MKETYEMAEIEQEIGLSPSWIRKMEAEGLLKIKAPHGTGRVARLYRNDEVKNMLRLSAMRLAGYTPEMLKGYRSDLEHFHKAVAAYRKNPYKRWEHDPVLLFDIRDLFPKRVDDIQWDQIPDEEFGHILDLIISFAARGQMFKEMVGKYRSRTARTLMALDHIENTLIKDYVEPLKTVIKKQLGRRPHLDK